MKNKIIKLLIIAALSITMIACGGSNSDGDNSGGGSNPTTTLTGVFLDSPVINADYKTQTQSGVTNSQGEYQYLAGETVTFSIGNLEFPSVTATSTVTPLDMAGTRIITAEAVVNMIRLLQSLDKDGNPENGIEITDAAKLVAGSVSFLQSTATFAIESSIVNLVSGGGQDTSIGALITEDSVIANFIIGLGRTTPTFTVNSRITVVVNPDPAIFEGSTSPDDPSYHVFCNRDSADSPPNENVGDADTYSLNLIIDNAQNKLVYYAIFEEYDALLTGNFATNNGILSTSLSSRTTEMPQDNFTAISTSDITLTYNVGSGVITGTEYVTQTTILNRNNVQRTCETTWEFTGIRN